MSEDKVDDGAPQASNEADSLFDGQKTLADGSIYLPLITTERCRANPERAKLQGRPVKCILIAGMAWRTYEAPSPDSGEVFTGLEGNFAAVVYDDAGEPKTIFKSDRCFLPAGHATQVIEVQRRGHAEFSYLFTAAPAGNRRGYSWLGANLAKLDIDNLSVIDRLVRHSIAAAEHSADAAPGLLADLRERALAAAKPVKASRN